MMVVIKQADIDESKIVTELDTLSKGLKLSFGHGCGKC